MSLLSVRPLVLAFEKVGFNHHGLMTFEASTDTKHREAGHEVFQHLIPT